MIDDGAVAARCIICGGAAVPRGRFHDDRYGFPGKFPALACAPCGHITLRVSMDADQVSDLYTHYYPRSTFDVEAWTPPRETNALAAWWRGLQASAYRWVPRNVRVLDIGCGFGESLGYHRQRGCDAQGVEADANIWRVAERHGLQVRVGLFDAEVYEPGSFDVVTLDQVIEHVGDPLALLAGVARVLKPGGRVIVSTPNANGWGARVFGQRWIHWHAPYHQQFFSMSSMHCAAESVGLSVESARTVTHSAWLGFQWCHLASPSQEGQPSPFWNPGTKRSAWHRLAYGVAAVIDLVGINAVLTRTFDTLGVGDNHVFVLFKPTA